MRYEVKSPSRTRVVELAWLRDDYQVMSPTHRAIRSRGRNKMGACFKCRHKFEDGEMMGLGCVKGKGNKVFCQACCEEIRGEQEQAQ